MLYLYHRKNSADADEIRERLEDMVAAHQVEAVGSPEELPKFIGSMEDLPAMKDGSRIVTGRKKILKHLEEFELLKLEWDKFQSDACYCGDDGEVI